MACEIASDAYDDGRMSEIKHETTPVPLGEKVCVLLHLFSAADRDQPKEKQE
jgi:hypothetical protein